MSTPYGLVRFGVAPDHQNIKAVIRVYRKVASREHVRFFGGVQLGRDITVEDLRKHYDQIIYAVGSETDRRLGIPGENLEGSYTATAFVGWYNSHPDYHQRRFNLSHERVVVVGVGNVAMDITRVLIRDPEELAKTDIAEYALEATVPLVAREFVDWTLRHAGRSLVCRQIRFHGPRPRELGWVSDRYLVHHHFIVKPREPFDQL